MHATTVRKCSGCDTLIEVCDRTPPHVPRYCSACMAKLLNRGCVECGAFPGSRSRLTWFKGAYWCDTHLAKPYEIERPSERRFSSISLHHAA